MRDYSAKTTIKEYEDRLKATQQQLVRIRKAVVKADENCYRSDIATRAALRQVLDDLSAQILELDDIAACLYEDRMDLMSESEKSNEPRTENQRGRGEIRNDAGEPVQTERR